MRAGTALIWMAVAALAGCGSGAITAGEATLTAGENSAGFLDRISGQTDVSENDAMRGMLLLLNGTDETSTFAQRVDALKSRGVVASSWNFDADRALTKGRLAYMVYQACDLSGGLTLKWMGPTQRYCLRELQHRSMVSEGSEWATVSGIEFVSMLSRAAAVMETGSLPDTMKTSWSN